MIPGTLYIITWLYLFIMELELRCFYQFDPPSQPPDPDGDGRPVRGAIEPRVAEMVVLGGVFFVHAACCDGLQEDNDVRCSSSAYVRP